MTTSLSHDATATDGWIRRFAESARATEGRLTSLDQQVGDGDFGTNLTAGADAAVRRLDRIPADGTDPAAPLEAAATAFLDEVGGTSGPLFGLLLQSLAAAVAASGPTTAAYAEGVADGLAAIRRVGDAAPGDKTLVDALAPAAEALRGTSADTSVDQALADAAEAAWEGVRSTARLRARMGRSSYLGERAEGIPDPGAVGVGLLFASAQGVVSDLDAHLG
ncbi:MULTISPECIES: dihydroxyacetone kinase subunit DhaL [Streptomyces]|uniref:DhaL domain-containing protein n=5 Tax=Streptomyces TaxID=1883 RepID=A0A8H9HJ67_9ACTN|nr:MULTISPECIES: dihydroxyacetone kinase subunit DhaL [Streptomyces]NEE40587.1 dihydroxyacetone kinase subunit L [Streptomyces sp. SID7982]NEE60663.1 dihydroxyacetone kinase subunit L [Streptomyces sp. SID8455]MBL3807100.1 dihydroxyacetone kinase subunit L [Streptomyces sp. BRB081]MDQ0295904.1 dihydroxyacetone kinase-like protein [Streptomyces sp. DSM 41037]NEC14244.1 dihydroxyacetone kinase subunit L [Streptomyces sp. SID8014]